MKKGYLQISFAWLFAIIVGAFILFLAIFFSTKLIKTEQSIQDAKTGKEIGILLNPLETGFESGKSSFISFPVETRIYNKCNSQDVFGRQIIQISQKSFNKWTETDIDVGFSNKYIFSENAEGKNFYIFSKPLDFPFKVTDLIYIIPESKEYCFLDAPKEIKDELSLLNLKNLIFENCSAQTTRVCFARRNCDIEINYNGKWARKNNDIFYFETDSLMYAAIFSDKALYECQVKRVVKRVEQLAVLYKNKASFISERGCDSNLELSILINMAGRLNDSKDLKSISVINDDLTRNNNAGVCKLW